MLALAETPPTGETVNLSAALATRRMRFAVWPGGAETRIGSVPVLLVLSEMRPSLLTVNRVTPLACNRSRLPVPVLSPKISAEAPAPTLALTERAPLLESPAGSIWPVLRTRRASAPFTCKLNRSAVCPAGWFTKMGVSAVVSVEMLSAPALLRTTRLTPPRAHWAMSADWPAGAEMLRGTVPDARELTVTAPLLPTEKRVPPPTCA